MAASLHDFAFVATTAPSASPSSRGPAEPLPATLQSLQDAVHAQGVLLQHMLDQIRTTQAHVEELHDSLADIASLLSGAGGAAEMKEHEE